MLFMNPAANDPKLGTIYNACVSARAFTSIQNFLSETFN